MKYIKHNLALINGVEIFPILAFALFFVFFIVFLVMVFRMDKGTVNHIKNLPFDTGAESDKINSDNDRT